MTAVINKNIILAFRHAEHKCIESVTMEGWESVTDPFNTPHSGREAMARFIEAAPLVGLQVFSCDDEFGDPVIGVALEWEESPESTTVYIGLDADGHLSVIENGRNLGERDSRMVISDLLDSHKARHPAFARDLYDLKDRLEKADVKDGFMCISALPTFGGGLPNIDFEGDVWSWDVEEVLEGSSHKLRVIARD